MQQNRINWNDYSLKRNLNRHRLIRPFHAIANSIFINYFKDIDPNFKILDIGCGAGFHLEILRNLGFINIEGIDASQSYVDASLEKGLNVKKMNAGDLDHSDKYDIIICCDIIEHLDDPDAILSLINKALKPDGVVYISIPVYDSLLERKDRLLRKTTKEGQMKKHDETHINALSKNKIIRLLNSASFSVRTTKHFYNQVPILWKLFKKFPQLPSLNLFGKFLVIIAEKDSLS